MTPSELIAFDEVWTIVGKKLQYDQSYFPWSFGRYEIYFTHLSSEEPPRATLPPHEPDTPYPWQTRRCWLDLS